MKITMFFLVNKEKNNADLLKRNKITTLKA